MAQSLAPLPQPGFSLHPGYTATQPHTFVAKGCDAWSDRASYLISYASPTGEAIAPFLEIVEKEKKNISFRTLQGQEVMRIVKVTNALKWKSTTYHGLRTDGVEVWMVKLKKSLGRTEYREFGFMSHVYGRGFANVRTELTISDPAAALKSVVVRNKIAGADEGVLVNGLPGATMSRHEKMSHVHRIDLINVAPGMDILLALGINWIRADKQKQDSKKAVRAAV
jgi:hypothetical protein